MPPISRLCEPIEGTSLAILAEKMGLDASKFTSHVSQAGRLICLKDDDGGGGEERMNFSIRLRGKVHDSCGGIVTAAGLSMTSAL